MRTSYQKIEAPFCKFAHVSHYKTKSFYLFDLHIITWQKNTEGFFILRISNFQVFKRPPCAKDIHEDVTLSKVQIFCLLFSVKYASKPVFETYLDDIQEIFTIN